MEMPKEKEYFWGRNFKTGFQPSEMFIIHLRNKRKEKCFISLLLYRERINFLVSVAELVQFAYKPVG